MEKPTKFFAHPALMWFWGSLGDALFVVGIVTGALKATIAGFTPISWFLMAIACYVGIVWSVAMRILIHLESKMKS